MAQESAAALTALGPHGVGTAAELDAFARLCRAAWPELVSTDRAGFFNRGRIRRLVIRLADRAYVVWSDGANVVHEIGGVSLGVVVRVQRTDPTAWAASLRHDFDRPGHPQTAY